MDILEKLNPSQREAVITTEGPLLIFAGAGSGKTRVITHRVAYLIREKQVPPYRIFAVTFTNKAAGEMKKRITDLIGGSGDDVFVKTFHSASVWILRRYGEQVGIGKNFSIYDSADQESIIKAILKDMNLDAQKIQPSRIAAKFGEIKDKAELLDGQDPGLLLPKDYRFDYAAMYKEYNDRLRAANAVDFSDLLIYTVKLLRDCAEVREALQRRWTHFMVDEYQDTNHSQYLIAKYLSSGTGNLCVVGDDDQSIYSWRGADIRNILDFERDYPNAKIVKLEVNYRSTSPILDAAHSVVSRNAERRDKKLVSARGDGENPVWCQTNNEYGEAEFIVNTMKRLRREDRIGWGSMAVFYRTNAQSRLFEDTLRHEGIPYRIIGSVKFYERKEIKDIVSYLRFLVNPFDTASLDRIINNPPRGIGLKTLEKLRDTAYTERISEWEVIDKEIPLDGGKFPKGLKAFRDSMISLMHLQMQIPEKVRISDYIARVIKDSGYRAHLEESARTDSTGKETDRLENVDEFINSAIEYEERSPEPSIDEFLQEISLLTSEENPENKGLEGITLMTVHNAKGLEFPVVFLTGMEEGTFPHANSLRSESDAAVEEERRLAYVGITRAMDKLFLSSAEIRRNFHEVSYRMPSRFISEIDSAYLEETRYTSARAASQEVAPSYTRKHGVPYSRPSTGGGRSAWQSQFKQGDRVRHPKYGSGTVVKTEGSGDDTTITVNFPAGRKVFVEKYTPLEKA